MAHFYRKLVLILLISLMKSEHVISRAARSALSDEERRPPLCIKLGLTRLDIPHAGNFSYAHMQQALHRSSLRLARFHYMLQLNGSAAATASNYTQLDNAAPSNYKAPLFADSTRAAFLTTLSIGTPPVSFNAVVDTGSDLVWLQCQPCSSCFTNQGPNTIFDPSLSSTYTMLPCSNPFCTYLPHHECGTTSCSYTVSYGDRSHTIGDLSLDALTLPDPSGAAQSIASFAFGCGHDNQGTSFSATAADGIVGLGLGPLSLTSQLGVSHLSYCLHSITTPTSKPSPLFLGEAPQAPPSTNGPTLTTKFFTNPAVPITVAPFYYVKLNGISVDGQLVTAIPDGAFDIQMDGTGGMIFDSGTTITMLKSDTYNAVVDAFTSAIALSPAPANEESSLCYELSSASNIQFPSLTFHFEGADLEMPLVNYFISYEDKNLVCLALGPSNQPSSIFGNIQQQNFFITYDLQAHTLSLTPSTCDS